MYRAPQRGQLKAMSLAGCELRIVALYAHWYPIDMALRVKSAYGVPAQDGHSRNLGRTALHQAN
jgi:hypothetical protein